MKLLQRLKIWRELKRLENRARLQPSPSTYVDLGQVYINLGMYEQTLRVADEGLTLFPVSSELRKLHKFAKRNQVQGRIQDVRERVNRTPHARLYQELAGLYLELGDYQAVRGTCEECIRRFPDDEGAHFVLARARLASFYKDLRADDGVAAVRGLQKVISLDPGSVKAHRLLAEVLFRSGASGDAQHHLEILRELAPQDPDIEAMLRKARGRPAGGDDLESLMQKVEAQGRLPHGPVARERPARGVANSDEGALSIRDSLAQIAEIAGVRKAAYIRGAKALVKGEIRDGKDSFLRVVRVIAKSAQRASRRMDIGNFSKGIVDGDFGHICLCSYGEVVAAVLCDDGTAAEQILADLQELVAGSLYVTGAAS